jgi:cytoskeletal protein RodZ
MPEENTVSGLATIRRNRGISLEQIAQATKISLCSLAAIERGEFRKLPGGIYTTSYLRQCARAIDYDESTLLAFFRSEMRSDDGKSSANRADKEDLGGFHRPSAVPGF